MNIIYFFYVLPSNTKRWKRFKVPSLFAAVYAMDRVRQLGATVRDTIYFEEYNSREVTK